MTGLYNADGQIQITSVPGTSYVGQYATDGSFNGVLDTTPTVTKGSQHPSGATNIQVVSNSFAGAYATDGARNVVSNNFSGYSFTPLGGAQQSAPLPAFSFSFAGLSAMPASTSFTRSSSATYFDSGGNLQTALTDVARFGYDFWSNKATGLIVEGAATNSIRNNSMQGVAAGTPGTLPTNWTIAFNATGLGVQVVGNSTQKNIDYVDIRIFGTTAAAGEIQLFFEATNNIASGNGTSWALSTFAQLVGGTVANLSYLVQDIDLRSAANADLGFVGNANNLSPSNITPNGWLRFSDRLTTNNASTAFVAPAWRIGVTGPGSAVDVTLRIGMPQLEFLNATSVIRTTTVAVSRSADEPRFTGAAATLVGGTAYGIVANSYVTNSNCALVGAIGAAFPGLGFTNPNYMTSNGFGVSQLNVAPTQQSLLNYVGLSSGGSARFITSNGGSLRGGTTATDATALGLGTTIGTDSAHNYPINGFIKSIDLYSTSPSLAQLESLTNPIETTAWGDSLTAGTGSTSPTVNYGYINNLSSLVQKTIYNRGVGGETSTQVKTRMLADTYHINDNVIIEVGRNNTGNLPSAIVADIQAMIAHLAPGNTRYVVLSIINSPAENSASSGGNLTTYNNILAINAAYAAAFPGHYLDVRAAVVAASGGANDAPAATWMYQAGLHPNDAGYQVMATSVYNFARSAGWSGFPTVPALITPAIFGSAVFSNSNRTIVVATNTTVRADTAISGKQVFSATLNTNASNPGIGITTSGSNAGALGFDGNRSIAFFGTGAIWRNGSNLATAVTYFNNQVGVVVDESAARCWFTVDGTNYYGSTGPLTKTQVEAGTSGLDISAVKALGTMYGCLGGLNANNQWTLDTVWPWPMLNGYSQN